MVEDILQIQGINSKGFGIIPKMVMQDKRLSVQSKAIYGYFCSFAGAGKTAFPRRDKIIHDLQISKGCYYKHFAILKECGYIKVEQEKNKQGFFTRNIYTLVESVPCTKYRDTGKQEKEPCIKSCDTEETHTSPCTISRDTVLRDTDIWDNKNNSIKNNSFYNHQSVSQDRTDRQEEIEYLWVLVKKNVSYDDLVYTHSDDAALIGEFISIILDTLVSKSRTVHINGEDKPRELVKSQLMKVSYDSIIHVLGQ